MAAVDSRRQRGRRSTQKTKSRLSDGQGDKGTESRRRRRRGSGGSGHSGIRSPASQAVGRRRDAREKRRRSQSFPKDAPRSSDVGDAHGRRRRERRRGRSRERRSRSAETERRVTSEEPEGGAAQEEVEEQQRREDSEEEILLPVPSPHQKLPRPASQWSEELDGDVAVAYRELRRWEGSREDDVEDNADDDDDAEVWSALQDAAEPQKTKPFSFLSSSPPTDESGSDGSVSAASVSGLSVAAVPLPGPWLAHSQVTEEGRGPVGGWWGRGVGVLT